MALTRIADLVVDTLVQRGIRDVFMVTGGGAMHLNDAIARHRGLQATCMHHEQAAAMAADGYFRMANRLAAVNVTSGPGAMNAINGVAGAWFDSLGMIVLSGQAKRSTLVRSTGLRLRQFGDQEAEIIPMVAGITKYAVAVDDPLSVRYHLERALYLATEGRPGPVWLELPLDVQGSLVDAGELSGYDLHPEDAQAGSSDVVTSAASIADALRRSQRPVVYIGAGVRLGGAEAELRLLLDRLRIPVVTALNGHDLVASDSPYLIGRPGTIGDRAGNFAVQNADFVLVLGTRLPIRQVGFDWASWAAKATVAMVDIDAAELFKPSLHVEMPVHADVREILVALLASVDGPEGYERPAWLAWCRARRERYPVVVAEHLDESGPINPYGAISRLFEGFPDDVLAVAGDGWVGVGTAQAATVRGVQRIYSNSGCGSMGHELPAAIGAAVSAPGRPVACIAGDGSIQMNIQELQTIVHHRFGIKIFVFNNGGYHSIRQTQHNYFPDGLIGFDRETGISFPDICKLAEAYGIPCRRVERLSELADAVRWSFGQDGPTLCELVIDRTQVFAPKAASRKLPDGTMVSAPLEDMAPFLERSELSEHLISDVVV